MKRLFAIMLLCLTITCCFTGCLIKDLLERDFNDEYFCYRIIDEDNVAVGSLSSYPESGVVFFPEKVRNYTVSKLGFSTGFGFGGNGYLGWVIAPDGIVMKRYYFPHTIKEVWYDYMRLLSGRALKIFYCGETINIGDLSTGDKAKMYVPSEKYDLFKNELSEYFKGSLLKANVCYFLNYDENNYYYVDYYENGEKVLYIPPEPQRDGYSFGGWFKESDCLNQWDFDTDALQLTEEVQEVKLYAKWIAG